VTFLKKSCDISRFSCGVSRFSFIIKNCVSSSDYALLSLQRHRGNVTIVGIDILSHCKEPSKQFALVEEHITALRKNLYRTHWSLEGDDGKTEYLGGRIHFPVYGKILTHEARLIVTRSDDAAALTFAKYDNKIYDFL
jgi:uncharacterized protein YuzB (UPF0349 family)